MNKCEQCEKPAAVVLQRRLINHGFAGTTRPDPDAPLHPRCGDHLYPGDAWAIDGLKPVVARNPQWAEQKKGKRNAR